LVKIENKNLYKHMIKYLKLQYKPNMQTMKFTAIKTMSSADNEYVKNLDIKYSEHNDYDYYISAQDAYFIASYDETVAKTACDSAKTACDSAKTACDSASDILKKYDAYNAKKAIYDSALIDYANAKEVTSYALANFTIAQNAYDAYIDACICAINCIRTRT
jgi:hypothetical protein